MARYKRRERTQLEIKAGDTPEEILNKLRAALKKEGDFPAHAQLVTELRRLAYHQNTSVQQITDVIIRDAALSTRLLHMVNSAFYHRAVPITTISQAVMIIGMRPIAELYSGLILMQKFLPQAKRGGVYAQNIIRSILTALITTYLLKTCEEEGIAERGYLAATFYSLGYLLLAYYFPQVYEVAAQRAQTRGHDVTQSVTEILGISTAELSVVIIEAVEIPEYYEQIILDTQKSCAERSQTSPDASLVNALAAADRLSACVFTKTGVGELSAELVEMAAITGYDLAELKQIMRELPELFRQHAEMIEVSFLRLPDHITEFERDPSAELPESSSADSVFNSKFKGYVSEIKESISNKEPISSIITTAMETLAYALEFERVLLLIADEAGDTLVGRMALGNTSEVDARAIERRLADESLEKAVDIIAFRNGSATLKGEPVLDDGKLVTAVPIGGKHARPVGIIYADSISSGKGSNKKFTSEILVLTDLLEQAVTNNEILI